MILKSLTTLIIGLLALILPPKAQADYYKLPALYDVTGVASNDVLNVRTGPAASFEKVGALPFDGRDVEVVQLSDSGTWGLVGLSETSGWVSMRFLRRASQVEWHRFDQPLYCTGTEPFWGLSLRPRTGFAHFEPASGTPRSFTLDWNGTQINRPPFTLGFGGTDGVTRLSAMIKLGACSDGMSDRTFGLSIDMFVHSSSGVEGYEGCCQISR